MVDKTAINKQQPVVNIVDIDERTWLPRYCRGDTACFVQLVNAYKAPIYSYLVRSGFDKSVCDDLFQDILVKIHLAAASYQPEKALKPWIFTIAVNTVRNLLRDRRHSAVHCQDVENLEQPGQLPEGIVELRQKLTSLEQAITKLPIMQSEVLQLVAIKELSHKEIALILSIPVNTVKTHLRRARQNLVAIYLKQEDCS